MTVEYKVIHKTFCRSTTSKAEQIEKYLNEFAHENWEFVALKHVMLLGTDVGFYLIMQRTIDEK